MIVALLLPRYAYGTKKLPAHFSEKLEKEKKYAKVSTGMNETPSDKKAEKYF